MSRTSLRPLIFLNAGLLAALAAVTLMPSASAQLRPRSTYTMVGGSVNGIVQGVVYITDETTNEVVAISWYENTKRLVGLGYRNMTADAVQAAKKKSDALKKELADMRKQLETDRKSTAALVKEVCVFSSALGCS